MHSRDLYLVAADVLLIVHALFVAFVVVGLALVLTGKAMQWEWVRNPWFRILHLAAIGVVVLQSWLGMICPLTSWEMVLREQAGAQVYSGTFVSHWVGRILYYEAPMWLFAVCYTLFGCIVLASWFWVRPRRFSRRQSSEK